MIKIKRLKYIPHKQIKFKKTPIQQQNKPINLAE